MQTLHLEIVTPEGVIFLGDVKSVKLPAKDGEIGILPGHAALVTSLNAGLVDIEGANSHDSVAINWGFCEVDEKGVSILADGAVHVKGDDEGELARAISKAKELIKSISSDNAVLAATTARIDTLK